MAGLPAGTVTFLLTDVEGSTRLWEERGAAMGEAIARHESLIGAAVRAAGGHVVKARGEGDSLFCVFASAGQAIRAAAAARDALRADELTSGLRVRTAVLTGEAELRDGDYYGPVVNRAARLRDAAHGGQIVLSQSTAALVADSHELVELGAHRLRDLLVPEVVHQLGPDPFPPLRVASAPQHNLPAESSSFVGRDGEAAQVADRISSSRLVTLAGAGGVGKTRLALHVARRLLHDFPDGVYLIDLGPLGDPDDVVDAATTAIGLAQLPVEPGPDRVHERPQRLIDHLRHHAALLVFDNCEHLVDAVAQLVAELLSFCPELRVMLTSREPIGLDGEAIFRVPSLRISDEESCDAVRLFVERAGQVDSTFSSADLPSVIEVCRRLDGIPLAIELAASKVGMLTVAQIAGRLDDAFRLLTGGSRTRLERHQTLRATVDWSHAMLSDPAKVVLRRLSVFVDGFTLDGAEAVCSGDGVDAADVLEICSDLVRRSLVMTERDRSGVRYKLLETIRQYAREKLVEAGESDHVRRRHLDWLLHYFQHQPWWGAADVAEAGNVLGALQWAEDTGQVEQRLRLVNVANGVLVARRGFGALSRWLQGYEEADIDEDLRIRCLTNDGYSLAWTNRRAGLAKVDAALLEAGPGAPAFRRTSALIAAARTFTWFDPGRALAPAEEFVAIGRSANRQALLAFGLYILGEPLTENGYGARAAAALQEAEATLVAAGLTASAAFLFTRACAMAEAGDCEAARTCAERSVDLALPDEFTRPFAMTVAGECDLRLRNVGDALAILRDATAMLARRGEFESWPVPALAEALVRSGELDEAEATIDGVHPRGESTLHRCDLLDCARVDLLLARGDHDAAVGIARAMLVAREPHHPRRTLKVQLEASARALIAAGHAEAGVRVLSATRVHRESVGSLYTSPEEAETLALLHEARRLCGDAACVTAQRAGAAMTLEDAVELVVA